MRPRLRALFVIVAVSVGVGSALAGSSAHAQSFDASGLRAPAQLGAKWRVLAGDNPAYAQPNFDDSHWLLVDSSKSLKTYFPDAHPRILWYRLHVKVAPQSTGLALEEWNLGSAFDIYVNGEKLIASGSIHPYRAATFNAHLLARIPDAAIRAGFLTIAMRVYISANDWVDAFPGYYPENLVIGQEQALHDSMWLSVIGQNAVEWFFELSGLGLAAIALALYLAQRKYREYLWIVLGFACQAATAPQAVYQLFHNLPVGWLYWRGCLLGASLVFQVLMYLAFLRLPVWRWMQIFMALAVAGILWSEVQAATGSGSALTALLSVTPEMALVATEIPALLIVHWRRGNREAGILLVPAVAGSLFIYAELAVFLMSLVPSLATASVRASKILFTPAIGPFTVNLQYLSGCLSVLALGIILVRRSTRIAQQQAQIDAELAAAREVQQILLPERTETMPGFAVESAYEPVREIGGDFYQMLPQADGSLLLVIGDVEGKGLPAAMLVSVLVGAIRGAAEYTTEPAELLANLNQRLVGRVGGSLATALAARISPDGAVVLANAGHLAPYLDGKEVLIAGALPLGAKAGTEYETEHFQLARGSRLLFVSDGVVEARNGQGELFGFERSRGLSAEPVARIVETAKSFGQNDDITAIAITRCSAAETSVWAVSMPVLDPLPS
ncbi:MAG: SpoIIE family protein phosphatase [Acidobacteriota bacterium]